jgi:spore cortex formation protein SpoVR/YcgB (stage V sporulation)
MSAKKTSVKNEGWGNFLNLNVLEPINKSQLIAGCIMIFLNVFSKYVDIKLSKVQEKYLRNILTRELLIFCVAFLGTHNLVLSLILTASFMVLAGHFFNENSRFCIIPDKLKYISDQIDLDKDGKISDYEKNAAVDKINSY